jgi:DNA-directed RNA polymerase subunit alpha
MNQPNFYIEVLSQDKNNGVYVISPLPRGMGYTIGNMLRRVLLSALPGAAVTHVKIKGVSHPFSTIKGLKEDVLNLLLNIKGLRFAFQADKEQKLTLKVKGAKKITAKDIDDSSVCKVINTDLYLGELAPDGTLEMEIYVNQGVGYEPQEEKEANEYGLLALDSIYSPVTNVSVKVENTRVGRKNNFDKLTMEVKTDGSLTGEAALKKASQLLVSYFDLLVDGGNEKASLVKEEKVEKKTANEEEENNTMMVDELDLPTRVINALIKHGIETVKQLSEMKDEDFTEIRGLGKKSIEELKVKLREMNLIK